MATGDKKSALKKLQNAAKSIKYQALDLNEINIGSPKEYLKLYHYLLLDLNPAIPLEIITKYQIELNGKNDKAFVDCVYRLMRDMLNYKPLVNKDQFFSPGFVELKALMTCEVINLIQTKFKVHGVALSGTSSSSTSTRATLIPQLTHDSYQNQAKKSVVSRVPSMTLKQTPLLVQNHRSNMPTSKSHEAIAQVNGKNGLLEMLTNGDEHYGDTDTSSQISLASSNNCTQKQEYTNEILLNKVDDLNEKYSMLLQKLNTFETPLSNDGKSRIQVSSKDYENLLNRVTLLENELTIVKQKHKHDIQELVAKFQSSTISSQTSINLDKEKLSLNGGNLRPPKKSINEILDDGQDETFYETPSVSFMMNNTNNALHDSHNSDDEDIDLTPKLNQFTSIQGILTESNRNQDKTPTAAVTPTNDYLSRAKLLLDKASALSQETRTILKN